MIWTPKPGQPEMVQWLIDRQEAALFATMGKGKTVVSLTAVSELILSGAAKGVLIVAPFRVCQISWPSQVEKWDHLQWLKVANMRTPEGQQAWEDGSADIYLINSEQLPSIERTVKGVTRKSKGFVEKFIKGRKVLPVDMLIVDELSLAKSISSKRFKALQPFLFDMVASDGRVRYRTPFKRRWGLTGTPAPNSYLDLFAQVRLLDNGKRLGRSFSAYRSAYFDSDYMGFKWTIREGAKEKIDAKLSDLAYVAMSTEDDDIPPCVTEDVEVALPAPALKAYRTLEKELLVRLKDGEIEALSAAALTTKLLQITAGCVFDAERDTHVVHDAKIDALRKLRKKHSKEPMLVFTSYTHERQRVLEAFPEARQFHENDLALWKAGKIKMWVSDARSLSHGIDGLQEAGRIAVWMTPTYSWETYAQAVARLVRMGQKDETLVYRIIAKGTIDEAVVETLRAKEDGNTGLMLALKNLQKLKDGS